jgi:peptide/nickel transport system ATP-binding protein
VYTRSGRFGHACGERIMTISTSAVANPASDAAAPVIECRNVEQTFRIGSGLLGVRKTLRAVDRVSLQIRRGEVLAIVGESGSGKTTLARILLGVTAPTSGEILFEGVPIATIPRRGLARRIQAVFQDPYSSLNPRKTISDIIALPLTVHGIGTGSERQARVLETMDLVGLPRRFTHTYPNQLSGGQRQRVAIARALVMQPDVIVCDEPTSALDVSVQAQILNLLQDLRERLSLTYVFVSHDLSVVKYIADRVAVMYFGRIVELADAKELFATPRHPYTRALLASVPTPDPHLGIPDPGIVRGFPDPLNPPPGCRFHPRCRAALPQCSTDPPVPHAVDGAMVECHLYQ